MWRFISRGGSAAVAVGLVAYIGYQVIDRNANVDSGAAQSVKDASVVSSDAVKRDDGAGQAQKSAPKREVAQARAPEPVSKDDLGELVAKAAGEPERKIDPALTPHLVKIQSEIESYKIEVNKASEETLQHFYASLRKKSMNDVTLDERLRAVVKDMKEHAEKYAREIRSKYPTVPDKVDVPDERLSEEARRLPEGYQKILADLNNNLNKFAVDMKQQRFEFERDMSIAFGEYGIRQQQAMVDEVERICNAIINHKTRNPSLVANVFPHFDVSYGGETYRIDKVEDVVYSPDKKQGAALYQNRVIFFSTSELGVKWVWKDDKYEPFSKISWTTDGIMVHD